MGRGPPPQSLYSLTNSGFSLSSPMPPRSLSLSLSSKLGRGFFVFFVVLGCCSSPANGGCGRAFGGRGGILGGNFGEGLTNENLGGRGRSSVLPKLKTGFKIFIYF